MTAEQKIQYNKYTKEQRNSILGIKSFIEVLRINPSFPTCILQDRYYIHDNKIYLYSDSVIYPQEDLPTEEKALRAVLLEKDITTEVDFIHNKVEYCKTLILSAKSREDIANIFFVKQNSHTYNNDISVYFKDKEFEKEYYARFHGKDNIGNYAKFGGNMW